MVNSPSEIIRDAVDMGELVQAYGFSPNRAGKIICPFHGEKTPSLKLYGKRWKCFGCNEGGDAIDFVRRLLGLSFPDAIDRISHDFALGIERSNPDPAALARMRAERAERERKKERAERLKWAVMHACREANWAIEDCSPILKPDGDIYWPDVWVEAAHKIDYLNYLLDDVGVENWPQNPL